MVINVALWSQKSEMGDHSGVESAILLSPGTLKFSLDFVKYRKQTARKETPGAGEMAVPGLFSTEA